MPQTLQPLIMGSLAANGSPGFHVLDRIFLACYALSWYVIGLFAPVHLAIIHPFPVKTGHFLPLIYYLSSLFIVLVLLLIFLLLRTTTARKEIVFGALFFLIHLSIALHIVPIGGVSVVTERYTYLACIGVFFILSQYLARMFDQNNRYAHRMKPYVLTILAVYIVFFSVGTYKRNRVWKNSLTLWSDQIHKYPDCAIAYNNRGTAQEDMQSALDDFTSAIALDPNHTAAYSNRGLIQSRLSDYQSAVEDLNKAVELHSTYAAAYYNRGLAKGMLADYGGALEDFTMVIALNPDHAKAYNDRGVMNGYLADYDDATEDFNTAIALDPHFAEPYYNRGNVKRVSGELDEACVDWSKAGEIGYDAAFDFINYYCR
jgi:Flp pilus assembly protein TadD